MRVDGFSGIMGLLVMGILLYAAYSYGKRQASK